MATRADYVVINDGEFALNPGETQTFHDEIPSDLVFGTNTAKPILAFRTRATPSGGSFVVEVNDTQSYNDTLSSGDVRVLWEVFPGTILNPGITNTVQFRATVNKVWFADVVLWFRREP
jgi:hypothetical protein